MALEQLGAPEMRATMKSFCDALVTHRDMLNQLNVYPVPDGDTGTNMALTLQSVVAALDDAGDDMSAVCGAISHGSLMGARGNSGVILSQILRALAGYVASAGAADAEVLANALRKASVAADEAVSVPVEGTILTVVRDVSYAATEFVKGGVSLVGLLECCLAAGRVSLQRTPELLPQLARANVVDAGGAGFLLLLDALATTTDGRPLPEPPVTDTTVGVGAALATSGVTEGADTALHGQLADTQGDAGLDAGPTRYEVMFFLEAPSERIGEFRSAWEELGDSIVIVGDDGLWNCHIHSNQIGASIETGIEVGRPFDIRITDLYEQVDHIETLTDPSAALSATDPVSPSSAAEGITISSTAQAAGAITEVVAVSVGSGVARMFESLGVRAIIAGGQTMNPSTADFLQAIEELGAQQVVLLPNNSNIIAVAEQVDACTEAVVRVIPTRGIAEGLAALVAYNPTLDAAQNYQAMFDAAAEVVAGEVTQAVRDTDSEIGPVAKGQWLGLDRNGLRVVANSAVGSATGLLAELLSHEHELVTVIYGADATQAQVAEIQSWLATYHPDIELEAHEGNQPLYNFYLGVE
ncbi:MAG: DAK2 domain-containing protein [bacterium]|nr:DAK2 domain-containing protein [bacterium]